jgi:hypothetical protein
VGLYLLHYLMYRGVAALVPGNFMRRKGCIVLLECLFCFRKSGGVICAVYVSAGIGCATEPYRKDRIRWVCRDLGCVARYAIQNFIRRHVDYCVAFMAAVWCDKVGKEGCSTFGGHRSPTNAAEIRKREGVTSIDVRELPLE